ncbi:hypothetical protein [Streptomyces sp. CBMA152]|uniref:hypothetical protein n=1 Tax=Streptomyces sp. CBMA152 TaxID=1896312 RepID=UPI001CB6E2BE|nr:hypothetical protein [Streptomyces sp. CBMA152]MBD0741469.1 hypothetical protein [Streptomyces sp. CBMA152]
MFAHFLSGYAVEDFAVGGLVLATGTGTGTGHLIPNDHAYTTAALVGIAAMAVTALTATALVRQRPPEINSTAATADVPSQSRSSR